jgi:hypothetical protein
VFLRQSTAQAIRFGPCLDKSDGVTEETGLTLAQADMRLSKDGGAFAQKSAAGNATHDSDGWYSTTLSATDTNTVGELKINVHQPANMLPVWERYWVIEEAVYDDVFGASAAGYASTAILTTAMTESYAANGVAPTMVQATFAIHQMLQQFGISGTSITVRKLDDSTTAFVVTLDDATTPTDAKRV